MAERSRSLIYYFCKHTKHHDEKHAIFTAYAQSNDCDGAAFLPTTQLNCQVSGENIIGDTDVSLSTQANDAELYLAIVSMSDIQHHVKVMNL